MASIRALAVRRANVEDQLAALAARVQARLATPLVEPTYSKVPEIAALDRLEWLAGLLTALLDTEAAPDEDGRHEVRQAPAGEPEPPPAPAPAAPTPAPVTGPAYPHPPGEVAPPPAGVGVINRPAPQGRVAPGALHPAAGNRKGRGN